MNVVLTILFADASRAEPALDPHEAMRQQPVPDGTCAICHAGPPTSGDPALQLPVGRVCFSCHPTERHVGVPTHLGRSPSAAASERAGSMSMPLVDGRIGCVTCHDPHPAPPERRVVLERSPKWWTTRFGPGVPASDLARLPGDALCTTCHPQGGLP